MTTSGSGSMQRLGNPHRTCYICRVAGHVARDCHLPNVCVMCGSPDHLKPKCPHQHGDASRQPPSRAVKGVPPAKRGAGGRSGSQMARSLPANMTALGSGSVQSPGKPHRTCYICRVAGHVARDCHLPNACVMCGSPDHLRPKCPHQQGDISRQTTLIAVRGVPPAGRGAGGRGGFVQRRAPLPLWRDAYRQDQLARGATQEKVYAMSAEETETREDVVAGLLLNSADHTLMGKQTVSVDSDESGSNNENADVESEDVDEEPSEEDPLEEDPDEDEPQEENSCEEPEEDPCVPNEDNSHEQELGRVASCEEEPNEMDSCGSPSEDERTGEQNEEPCQEEPFEEDEQCEEEKQNEESCEEEPCEEEKQNEEGGQCEKEMRNMRNEESCEEEPCEEEELCEEEMRNEACEEESYGEEMVEEPREESEEEKQCKEEPLEEEPCEEPEQPSEEEPDEEARDKEAEEEPSEDPEEVSNEGSPVSQSYNRKDAKSTQSNSKKMRISSNIATEPKRTFNTSGIHISPNNVTVPVKLGTTARTGKRRQSKWDVKGEANEPAEGGSNVGTKKRKSRWSNDVPQTSFSSPLKHPVVEIDLKIQKFNAQLLDVDKKLQPGVNDDQLQSERFPSPPPIYNNLGIKINSREARVRSKLMRKKQAIISKLIKKNPNFKPPPDYNTTKLCKKIFAPSKEYPGYNFAGLILGPCGNTVKKLEQETGARIMLHGRGTKFDSFEDLHVLIEADDKYSMDAAVAMVEKLLNPVDDGHNELKHSQLRELAEIRGNLKENYANNSNKPDTCNVCGDTSHPTSSCPLIAPIPGANSNGEKVNFAEIGSGLSPFNAQPPLSVCSIPSMNNSTSHASRPKKVIDNANLYVGCLPQSVDDNALIELFAHFGSLSKVNVIRDWSTNISKGYGFVMYADSMSAAKAVAQMNGVEIDGKVLAVRIAGILPPSSHINQLPSYSGTSVITQNNPPPMCWPGPPESRLPETVASLSSNCSYPVHHNPFSGQYLGFQTPPPNSLVSGNFSTSTELGQFPGYLKSLDSPPLLHRPSMPSDSVPSSQDHFIHNFGCHQMPPT